MKFSRKTFFDGYRVAFGPLNQEEVTGLEFLLGAIEKDTTWKDIQQIAYLLATIKHETAGTFQPIKEYRAKSGKAKAQQDKYWSTGFYGRGYIQLTWEANYQKFGIAKTPEKALEPETAFRIASRGMQQGLFTGKKLSDYIKNGKADYLHARQIVNGMDKAKQIAGIAEAFERILTDAMHATGGWIPLPKKDVIVDVTMDDATAAQPIAVEPDKPAEPDKKDQVTTVDSTPPVINVPTPKGSITSKIAAASAALGPILGATGLKLGGVEFSAASIIAICAMIMVGMVTGAVLWDRDRERQLKRQLASTNNLADRSRVNVVAGELT